MSICSRLRSQRLWPPDDQRNVNATFMGVLFVPTEWRVTALCPPPWVIRVGMRPANVVDPFDCLIGCFQNPIEELHFVHHPERTTFLRGTVVCKQHKNGVVELAEIAQAINKPPDLVIGVIEKRRERLLQSACETTLVVWKIVPRLNT